MHALAALATITFQQKAWAPALGYVRQLQELVEGLADTRRVQEGCVCELMVCEAAALQRLGKHIDAEMCLRCVMLTGYRFRELLGAVALMTDACCPKAARVFFCYTSPASFPMLSYI